MAATGNAMRVVGLSVALSILIDVLQGMIPGRYPGLGDVVNNAVGGTAGAGIGAIAKQLLWPSRRLAGALTVGTGAAAAVLLFMTGVLLAPSFPATIYYGQWTADLDFMEA